MKGKVAFLYGPKDLRIEEVDVSKFQPNQVLIKTGCLWYMRFRCRVL